MGFELACRKASDAELTIPSATVPRLRAATSDLRDRRLRVSRFSSAPPSLSLSNLHFGYNAMLRWLPVCVQLQAKNAATFAQIAKDSASVARTEAQIAEMVADFDKVTPTCSRSCEASQLCG